MNIKKTLLAGLLGGALLLSGSQVFAAPPEMPDNDDRSWQEEEAKNIGGWAKYLSDKYGVDSAQVETALNNGVHIEDVRHAAVLAKLSNRSFSDVLAMKVDWFQVAEKLGVTHKQIRDFYEQERTEHFAQLAELDIKTFNNLLKDGYKPHDIMVAGKIAKVSGKNIKNVLDKRKINNTWEDVAKSFGVDIKKYMPPDHPKVMHSSHGHSNKK